MEHGGVEEDGQAQHLGEGEGEEGGGRRRGRVVIHTH